MKLLRPEHHLEEEEDFLKGNGDDGAVDDDISHEGSGDADIDEEKEDATPLPTPGACSTLEVCRKVRSRFQAFALVN